MGGQNLPKGGEAYERVSSIITNDCICDVSRFDTERGKEKVAHPFHGSYFFVTLFAAHFAVVVQLGCCNILALFYACYCVLIIYLFKKLSKCVISFITLTSS